MARLLLAGMVCNSESRYSVPNLSFIRVASKKDSSLNGSAIKAIKAIRGWPEIYNTEK